jgi:hypothetical protein
MSSNIEFDSSVVDSLQKDLNTINVWLQNIADIPPETKLTKDGTGFTLYPDTWRAWFVRTVWTNDSGRTHTTEFKSGYEKIEMKLRECMLSEQPLDRDYYQNISRLLALSKKGLNNFMHHHDYRENTYITGNVQNLCNFIIPRQIKLIKDYLHGERISPMRVSSEPIDIPKKIVDRVVAVPATCSPDYMQQMLQNFNHSAVEVSNSATSITPSEAEKKMTGDIS